MLGQQAVQEPKPPLNSTVENSRQNKYTSYTTTETSSNSNEMSKLKY